jgi:competence protein ComEC
MLVVINFNLLGNVTVLDVGQGDAILVQVPFNQGTMLIDTGGDPAYYSEREP